MTLDEVMSERPVVTRREARREIEIHGLSWAEFVAEMGDHDTYDGADVLAWMGY